MQLFSWVPDRVMLALQYRIKTGRTINWNNPERFTEKLQIYKMLSRSNTLMAQCADKADVRRFVSDKGLSDILIPLVGKGIYETEKDIDWAKLPEKFVLKDTLGGGGNSVIVCTNKKEFNKNETMQKCASWISHKYKHAGREHVYDKKNHRIIVEQYLDTSDEKEGMVDYKFFCFDGMPKYLYVISNRILGKGAELGIYDINFNLLPYVRVDEKAPSHAIVKPKNYEHMIEIARRLSEGFPEVRIDLYNIGGRVFFGEMTFFDGSGYMTFSPDEFDFMLGKPFNIRL